MVVARQAVWVTPPVTVGRQLASRNTAVQIDTCRVARLGVVTIRHQHQVGVLEAANAVTPLHSAQGNLAPVAWAGLERGEDLVKRTRLGQAIRDGQAVDQVALPDL